MLWYFAANAPDRVALLLEEKAKSILVSFAYLKKSPKLLEYTRKAADAGCNIMVDSGAYTNLKHPGWVTLKEYVQFLKDNGSWMTEYIGLDDPQKRRVTLSNYLKMKDAGLSPIVVDHVWFTWHDSIAAVYKAGIKMCWGGMLSRPGGAVGDWAKALVKYQQEPGKKPGRPVCFFQSRRVMQAIARRLQERMSHAKVDPKTDIHLLAVGARLRWMLPFFDVVHSFDSTSAFMPAGFGRVLMMVPEEENNPPKIRLLNPREPSDELKAVMRKMPRGGKILVESEQERRRFNIRTLKKYYATLEECFRKHKSKGFDHLWQFALEKKEDEDGALDYSRTLFIPASFDIEGVDQVLDKVERDEPVLVTEKQEPWSPDGYDEDGQLFVEKQVPPTAASDEDKRSAQKERSRRFGIEVLEGKGERLSFPPGFPTDLGMYGDPVNLMYPLDPPGRARNARSRFKQFADRTYSKDSSKRIVHTRIVRRLLNIGAKPSFDPDDSLDALLPADLRGELQKQASTVQTVICSKERFGSLDEAKRWIREHEFEVEHEGKPPDETSTSYRFRQQDPGDFEDGSFRTIDITDGVKAVIGILKGVSKAEARTSVVNGHSHLATFDESGNGSTSVDNGHSHEVREFQVSEEAGHSHSLPESVRGGEEKCSKKCGACRRSKGVGEAHHVDLLPVRKADEERRIVFGVVLEPDTVDAQGDSVSAEEIERAAHLWLAKHQERGLMHRRLVNKDVEIYESYVAPQKMEVGGHTVKAGTWMLMYHILSDKIWADVKSGKLTGFSMGGYARRVPPAK